ncbi:anaerobic ribonucleoside-triphosphate reductase activating protein [Candidatus Pacearchaeota archaeon]|nr:anaerobic ribonucleoside-triphosphate reductase activating protein [Candidatus Pacearchaeota archaeon]
MKIYEQIKGLVPSSLVDWDGKVVSVIFLAGCNFKCKFCSNKDLVLNPDKLKTIPFKEIEKYFKENKEFIDGVVITGGEPTIYEYFPALCRKIKELGFKVKIDTNGTNPEMLKELLDEKLVDFAAMDIKTSFENYSEIIGAEADLENIKKSIEIISKFPEYEFRTTIYPEIKKQDLIKIAVYLKEKNANQAFFLQQFRNDVCIEENSEKIPPYKKEEVQALLEEIKPYFINAGVRNI